MFAGVRKLPGVLALATLLIAAAPAAEVVVRSAPELSRAAREAQPGDHILVAPGVYPGVVISAQGIRAAPVLIAALDPAAPPVFSGMIYAPGCSWVTFRRLLIRIGGESIVNGINADDAASGIPAKGLSFEQIGFAVEQGNGLKLAGVDEFSILECAFTSWSQTGLDLVGCHRGVIEGCRFETAQPVYHGIQIKGGSSDILVRGCRFDGPAERWINIGGGTDADLFRPRDAPYEAARIRVEDNSIFGGRAAIAFDAAVDSAARMNLISDQRQFVFRILNSTRSRAGFQGCRNGVIERNLVSYRSDRIESVFNLGYGADWGSFRLAGNVWRDALGLRIPRFRGWLRWFLPSLWDLPSPEFDSVPAPSP